MHHLHRGLAAVLWLSISGLVWAIELDLDDPQSIKDAAAVVAKGMMTFYNGDKPGGIPGLLPPPYYWWESGAMWGQLINYWYYTGDDTYNAEVMKALLFQVGPNEDYMPPNQTKAEGNDDQAFWAFTVMDACELKFENPPADQPQWLALAQAVFNQQVARWDSENCGGGLRWQIYPFNNGYNYKNTISNAGFFQLAARLARYTNNQTYADKAEEMFEWMLNSPILIDRNTSYWVNDGTSNDNDCADPDRTQWTYNYGTLIAGSAYLYNWTNGSELWKQRLDKFIAGLSPIFFAPERGGGNVMCEWSCELNQKCNYDQPSFKAYLTRWLVTTMQLAPYTWDTIKPKLEASAMGAAQQCTGQPGGDRCGRRWYQAEWDGFTGVGEQMSALAVITANLVPKITLEPPVTVDTGGNSTGNPAAGTAPDQVNPYHDGEITTADRAGAGIITALLLIMTVGGSWFMVS
ncbi:glycoside hydrolase family 76 protein [Patellaria atrata CBS 101060]|uniref:Mannan endo-1,6-alpha-mannosidase n=1 Tax=Patellaria atrata CBS 101060 TaxID=1346257 RepID=A0A9P4SDW0_9PEZI|nr:glycoside hydrolase family 76 protein [Patellaria atrata CBS 101060]